MAWANVLISLDLIFFLPPQSLRNEMREKWGQHWGLRSSRGRGAHVCRDKGPWGCQLHMLHKSHQRSSWTVFDKQLWLIEAHDPPSHPTVIQVVLKYLSHGPGSPSHNFHQSQRECRGSVGSSLPCRWTALQFPHLKVGLKILRPALQALGAGWLP